MSESGSSGSSGIPGGINRQDARAGRARFRASVPLANVPLPGARARDLAPGEAPGAFGQGRSVAWQSVRAGGGTQAADRRSRRSASPSQFGAEGRPSKTRQRKPVSAGTGLKPFAVIQKTGSMPYPFPMSPGAYCFEMLGTNEVGDFRPGAPAFVSWIAGISCSAANEWSGKHSAFEFGYETPPLGRATNRSETRRPLARRPGLLEDLGGEAQLVSKLPGPNSESVRTSGMVDPSAPTARPLVDEPRIRGCFAGSVEAKHEDRGAWRPECVGPNLALQFSRGDSRRGKEPRWHPPVAQNPDRRVV